MINNLIVISDTHCGCQLGLMPPEFRLRHGPLVRHSRFQRVIWNCWQSFWTKWVPRVTRGEPYAVVHNGDVMDGRHHNSTSQISQDIADQANIAYECLAPVVDGCQGRFYVIGGTAVHAGEAAENEETLAERLGAVKSDSGNSTRFELYMKVGSALVHLSHHIGVTSSMSYEGTALTKEYVEFCSESARWDRPIPDIVVRSHRHRHFECRVPTSRGYGVIFVTAGWQLKTPYLYRVPGGRVTTPMLGGSLIRQGDEEFFTRHKTWETKRAKTEIPKVEVPK